MKFNYKKISAVFASALMLGLSAGVAGAASYPAPFVSGGVADVAIVYGTGAGVSDLDQVQGYKVNTDLQSYMGSGSSSTSTSVSGEAVDLGNSGTRIYVNDSLNKVKQVLTDTNLPIILKDSSFSGNVDANLAYTIDIGSNPKIQFKKQPTTENDPQYGVATSTSKANYIYNTTATFSKAVNFSHADSEGEEITLFGQEYTVASATDSSNLVLLKSAEKLSLSSDAPSADVTIGDKTYTIELVSANDADATVKVTDSTGASASKEISEAASKKVNGVTVAVITADENNLKLSASLVVGSDKITLTDDTNVKFGEDDTSIDGTNVDFETGNPGSNITALTISVYAAESDKDAILAGSSFVDPVYGTFKIDFSGFNIGVNSSQRDTIKVLPNGDDKSDLTMTDHRGDTKTFMWAKDSSTRLVNGVLGSTQLVPDDDNKNITVVEFGNITYGDYVVVGNEDSGYLLKLDQVDNSSDTSESNSRGDKVIFDDVFSGDEYKATFTSDGVGSVTVGGYTYAVYMDGDANNASEDFNVFLDYPDTTTAGNIVLFPSIQTKYGAKVAFYQPTEIALAQWGIRPGNENGFNVSGILIPDGDGYETATIVPTYVNTATAGADGTGWTYNITMDGATKKLNVSGMGSTGASAMNDTVNWSVGGLTFVFTNNNVSADADDQNKTVIYLLEPDGGGYINTSALIVWEEEDDNNIYNANIIVMEEGSTSNDGLGVDVAKSGSTWNNVSSSWRTTRHSDSQITDAGDLWGTILTFDQATDSDQASVVVSYPDEQLYGLIYVAEATANIVTSSIGSAATKMGVVVVKDTEISNVSSKNLIVVGGSCINSVAATLIGSAACGADFTTATTVGVGKYIIKGYADKFTTGKIALLVAGYEAADTVAAVDALTSTGADTSAEKIGP